MCGGLGYLGWTVVETAQPRHDRSDHDDELLAELKRLYARGDIDRDSYIRLRDLASYGQLDWRDLAEAQGRAKTTTPERGTTESATTTVGDPEVRNNLAQIRGRLARLAEARKEPAAILADLETKITGLRAKAAQAEEDARVVLSADEESARTHLARKQDLLASAETLESRAATLRHDLAQLDELRSQLELREAELKAVGASQQLAGLQVEIREGSLR